MEWLIYLIKVAVCSSIFFSFYHFLLSRYTFYNFNRYYLIAVLFLSFIIPALTIKVEKEISTAEIVLTNKVPYANSSYSHEVENESYYEKFSDSSAIDWKTILVYLYWSIVTFLILKLLFTAIHIFKKGKNGKLEKNINYILVDNNSKFKNSSCFWYLFIDRSLPDNLKEQIKAHELIHINRYHSIDKLLANIYCVFLWFNPFAYYLRNAIDANQEYEADLSMLKILDKKIYTQLILSLAHPTSNIFANHFSKLPLKRRIKMLYQKPTNNMKRLIYLFALPVIALCCAAFIGRKEVLVYQTYHQKNINSDNFIDRKKEKKTIFKEQSLEESNNEYLNKETTLPAVETSQNKHLNPLNKSTQHTTNQPRILVIDAGHGGKDEESKAINGIKEKDLNMRAANILKDEAEKRNIKVIMTRNTDQFLTLKERVDHQVGDAFISLHHNSIPTTDEDKKTKKIFKGIEIIVSKETIIKESEIFGISILKSLKNLKGIEVKDSLVNKQLYILKNAKIPSIIIELGNVSYQESFDFVNEEENIRKICNLVLDGYMKFQKL